MGALALAAGAVSCSAAASSALPDVRLGYFPNLTHAPAIAGTATGGFERALAGRARLRAVTFNAGPDAVQALFAGAIDIAYLGPTPAINAHERSGGEAIRIIAGATSGGAALVAGPSIRAADDLAGKTVATPQLGNTQDVALRTWLASAGFVTTKTGGGDVNITPQPNAQSLETFRSRQIAGAWLPEPWVSRLVLEGGGHVLVDEAALWPSGRFATTNVVVRTEYLRSHADIVEAFLRAHVDAVGYLAEDPGAKTTVNNALKALTGKALRADVLDRAWSRLEFTVDPLAASLRTSAAHAVARGLLKPHRIDGLYALDLLNGILAEKGRSRVAA